MPPEALVAAAVAFTWLGMVVAISFIEAPLKFQAPGVTVPIGLGIGRIVFRALNIAETVLAVVLAGTVLLAGDIGAGAIAAGLTVVILVVQLVVVRPRLGKRTNRVLAGEDAPRSRTHLWYVALETVKVPALIATGVLMLTG